MPGRPTKAQIEERKALVKEALADDMSIDDIVTLLGVTKQTVKRYIGLIAEEVLEQEPEPEPEQEPEPEPEQELEPEPCVHSVNTEAHYKGLVGIKYENIVRHRFDRDHSSVKREDCGCHVVHGYVASSLHHFTDTMWSVRIDRSHINIERKS